MTDLAPPDASVRDPDESATFAAATPCRPPMIARLLRSRVLWTIVAIFAFALALARLIDSYGGPQALRDRLGGSAPLLTVPLHAIVTVSPLPSDGLCVANGMIYGFWWGAVLSWLGWWLAGIASFTLGARARQELALTEYGDRLPSWLRRLPISHPLYLILARQIPGIGGDATTFVPGLVGVPFTRHLWCSAIAIVPGSLLMSAIGAGIMAR